MKTPETLGEVVTTDVLVVGGGIGGLAAAIKAKEKGADVLLDPVVLLPSQGIDAPVTLIGDGPDGADLPDIVQKWLQVIEDTGLARRPMAVEPLDGTGASPDFVDRRAQAAIYVDGDNQERQSRDADPVADLEAAGSPVIRFGPEAEWRELFARFPSVFGEPSRNSRTTPAASSARRQYGLRGWSRNSPVRSEA